MTFQKNNHQKPWQAVAFATMGLVTAFVLASCVAITFDHPLPIPKEGLKVDERIVGSWVPAYDDGDIKDDSLLNIYPRPTGWVDVFVIGLDKEDGEWAHFSGYSVKIKDKSVLCLWPTEQYVVAPANEDWNGKPSVKKLPFCMLFPYTVTDDGMFHFWHVDVDKIITSIKDEKIKGDLKLGDWVKVHATSEELEAFFNEVGVAGLASENQCASFYRLNQPDSKPFTPPEKP